MKKQHLKTPRLTKRQRKAQKGANSAAIYSLKNGDLLKVSDSCYRGRPPAYRVTPEGKVTKVAKGIPYVRTECPEAA